MAASAASGRRLSATRKLHLTKFYFYQQRRQPSEQVQEHEQGLLMLGNAAPRAPQLALSSQPHYHYLASSATNSNEESGSSYVGSSKEDKLPAARKALKATPSARSDMLAARARQPHHEARQVTGCVSAETAPPSERIGDADVGNYERCCYFGAARSYEKIGSSKRSTGGGGVKCDAQRRKQERGTKLSLESDDNKSLESSLATTSSSRHSSFSAANEELQRRQSRVAANPEHSEAFIKEHETPAAARQQRQQVGEISAENFSNILHVSSTSEAPPSRHVQWRGNQGGNLHSQQPSVTSNSFITSQQQQVAEFIQQHRRSSAGSIRSTSAKPSIEEQLRRLFEVEEPLRQVQQSGTHSAGQETTVKQSTSTSSSSSAAAAAALDLSSRLEEASMKKGSYDKQAGKLGAGRDNSYYNQQSSNTNPAHQASSSKYHSSLSPDDRMMIFMMASRRAAADSSMEKNARILKWLNNCKDARG